MARTISTIRNSILAAIAGDPMLSAINSPSSTAIWSKWVDVVATAMATEEQLNDQFISASESITAENAPGTVPWIQRMLAYFQYSASTPQIIQLDTTTLNPYYATEDASLRIITRNAIIAPVADSTGHYTGTPGVVLIKVAKDSGGGVPGPLTAPEQSALSSYLTYVKPAGIIYNVLSVPPDRLFCEVKIWYTGIYSATIQNSVRDAYNAFIASLPFNGVIKLSDLEGVLRSVTGVTDVEFKNVNYRRSSETFTYGTNNMVNTFTELQPTTQFGLYPYAGYLVDETTAGYDFLTVNASNYFAV